MCITEAKIFSIYKNLDPLLMVGTEGAAGFLIYCFIILPFLGQFQNCKGEIYCN